MHALPWLTPACWEGGAPSLADLPGLQLRTLVPGEALVQLQEVEAEGGVLLGWSRAPTLTPEGLKPTLL